MNQVFLLCVSLELIACAICFGIHIAGSSYLSEPLPHNVIFCGTFGGYMLVSIFINVVGMLMHFTCAICSLYYAETDFHLIFMGPQQELSHIFFSYCKMQSVASLVAGATYMLHGTLILDFILMTPRDEDKRPVVIVEEVEELEDSMSTMNADYRDHIARTSPRVYFISRRIDHWFCVRFKFFRQLARGQWLATNEDVKELSETLVSEKSFNLTADSSTHEEQLVRITQILNIEQEETISVASAKSDDEGTEKEPPAMSEKPSESEFRH
ncbi:uncharacterized protein LOC108599323 [Drosophila busckii]|uniref:uncharacterized protein LOC108599323 n=1 Tax=Drosophila busckii TaxID=30019 RepID=UPI00083ECC15|nr:uncharacterized protein LOC108599323 [Drosophila busckii]